MNNHQVITVLAAVSSVYGISVAIAYITKPLWIRHFWQLVGMIAEFAL